MSLDARVCITERDVDATLQVERGSTLALLGANGAGKSTALEAIAGLLALDGGHVELEGATLEQATRPRVHTPARNRRIVLLTQDDALFPTMSVLDNVAYGPRATGMHRAAARDEARAWLARVGLAGVEDRRPSELSGGQARRVALARALAARPRVLLLDEPFAGLDVEAASAMRALAQEILSDLTCILTTHDSLDAHVLADHVAVMEAGRVVEAGPATTVLRRPRTPFAARMAARVLITGTMRGGRLEVDGGGAVPVTGRPGAGERAAIAVHPGRIALTAESDRPRTPGIVWLEDSVRALEPRGDEVRVHGERLAADVEAAVAATLAASHPVAFGVPAGMDAYAL